MHGATWTKCARAGVLDLNAMTANSDILQAALTGYQAELTQIKQTMADIRRELKPTTAAAPVAPKHASRAKRKISAAGRKNIIAALKKRWAEYHKQQSTKS